MRINKLNSLSLLLLLFFLFDSNICHSLEAVIIVLEAPLLKSQNLNSQVLQLKRKGETVYVPERYGLVSQVNLPEYLPTYDRAGNRAFVASRYLKIITDNTNELDRPIVRAQHDPTDYRLEEPIPPTYPFDNKKLIRTSFSAFMGTGMRDTYNYTAIVQNNNYGTEIGGQGIFTINPTWNENKRFFWGLIALIGQTENKISFKNGQSSTENRGILKAGPYVDYDVFRNPKYVFTIGGGVTINLHRTTIESQKGDNKEELNFTGISLSPIINTQFSLKNFIQNLHIISGISGQLYLPHSQKSYDETTIPELWGDESKTIKGSLSTQVSLYLGTLFEY